MKWDDNLLLEGDEADMALRGQYQFAMYAIFLSCGNSIYCKRIKAATIEQYVLAAASFIALFSGTDYRKDHPSDNQMGYILSPIFRDLKKFETIPNRREPYEPRMHLLARQLASRFPSDSLVSSLVDCLEEAYCAGFRLSEFAQPTGRKNPLTPQLNHMVSDTIRTRAVVPVDFRIQTNGYDRASGLAILGFPLPRVARMWVKFRTQKNGQHGEEKMFVRNPNPTGFCFVSSVYRALARFQRLQVRDPRINPHTTPLSVYWSPTTNSVKLIDAKDIATFMQRLASTVYKLHPVHDAEDIRKWGVHSLRVGACVTLHAMGFSTLDIQWVLRWRSTAFMVYLRNVAILGIRHNAALDRAAAQPFI